MAECKRLAGQEIVPLPQLHVYAFVAKERFATQLSTEHLAKGEGPIPHYRPKIALFFSNCCCFFFALFPALFGKISALFSPFFCTVPDALYPLHVVFDILVNEYQFTFIFVTLFGKTDTNALPFKRGNRLLSI